MGTLRVPPTHACLHASVCVRMGALRIPPSIYKRGPGGSENCVLEALEGLLAKHGLDAHSKDHEIKVRAPLAPGHGANSPVQNCR